MHINFKLSAVGSVKQQKVDPPMKLHEAKVLGKRTLEEKYGMTAEYESYQTPRQPATKPDDDCKVERGSTLQFTSQLPTPPMQGVLAFLMEDKMFDILAGMSSRLLGPEKVVSLKDTLQTKYSDPDEQARIAPVVKKLESKGIKLSNLGKALDDAYYKRNCTTHANDKELERQVKKFIRVGGIDMLQADFPTECALLLAYDDIKGMFL